MQVARPSHLNWVPAGARHQGVVRARAGADVEHAAGNSFRDLEALRVAAVDAIERAAVKQTPRLLFSFSYQLLHFDLSLRRLAGSAEAMALRAAATSSSQRFSTSLAA